MENLLRSGDVADELGISIQTARRWMREGVIPSVRIGSFWYVRQAELEKLFTPKAGGDRHAA